MFLLHKISINDVGGNVKVENIKQTKQGNGTAGWVESYE